ncbi:hypothetical protein CYMTET_31739, partial [Cymbomonas tetramitiformis]
MGELGHLGGPLQAVPQEVLTATRELATLGLLEEGAGSGPLPVFTVASGWLLRGTWSAARAVAKKRMKAVKAWGTTMLAGLAAAPAPAGGLGALGLVVSGGAPGGTAGGPAGAEGQYRKALAASQGKRDGWSVDRHKQDFVKGKELGMVFEDVLDDSFARKRQRSPSPPAEGKRPYVDPGILAGAGSPGVVLTPGRRGELAAAAAGLRTVTEEQLQQALMGTLSPEAVPKPAGQSLDAQQAKLVLGEDGRSLQWESANKRTRCSTLPEWERGFCFVLRK